jgi:DNA-binding transcriptional regulator GbsR (MarR family)
LERLTGGESSVTALAEPFDMSLPAVSKHLRVLERAGLLTQEKDGRVRRCRVDAAPMKEAADWIGRYRKFWEEQLDSLAGYIDRMQQEESEKEDSDDSTGNSVRDNTTDKQDH